MVERADKVLCSNLLVKKMHSQAGYLVNSKVPRKRNEYLSDAKNCTVELWSI